MISLSSPPSAVSAWLQIEVSVNTPQLVRHFGKKQLVVSSVLRDLDSYILNLEAFKC